MLSKTLSRQVSSLIPDSIWQYISDYPVFKSKLLRLGFSFLEEEMAFDLPSKEFVISLEKPFSVEELGEERQLVVKVPRVTKNYPGISEKQKIKKDDSDINFSPSRSSFYIITDTSFLCGKRVGRLRIYPFTYDQQRNLLSYKPLAVSFSEPDLSQERTRIQEGEKNFFSSYPVWYKLKIDSSGIYKVTGKELKKAGMNLSQISPQGLKLFNIGEFLPPVSYPDSMIEVPIYVYTGQDGRFDEDDYLLFYGRALSHWKKETFYQNIFSLWNYYWLTYSETPGKRIPFVPLPSTASENRRLLTRVHWEKDNLCPARGGYLWVEDVISLKSGEKRGEKVFSFPFPKAESLKKISLRVYSLGQDFWVFVSLGGYLLDSVYIPSARPPEGRVIEIETNRALAERCELKLEVLTAYHRDLDVFTDYFEFTYTLKREIPLPCELFLSPGRFKVKTEERPLVMDVTRPFSPILLDCRFVSDTLEFALRDSSSLYITSLARCRKVLEIRERQDLASSLICGLVGDYFIISPAAFFRLAGEFANYRRKNPPAPNFLTHPVKLEDIYDIYLFGIEEPYAIKRFFKKKRPQYGLLLGDGSYDYRNLLKGRKDNSSFLPPYEYGWGISYDVYEFYPLALDAWYADFEDEIEPRRVYPDFILGRLPCRSNEEGGVYLKRLQVYETQTGDYENRFLFCADDEYEGDPYKPDPCGLGVHILSCERLAAFLPRSFEINKVYLTEYPLSYLRDKPDARKAFFDELRQGSLGVVYFGHGAGFRLAHEQLLNIEDVFNIKTCGQYPFGYFASCGVGRFDDFELGRYREAIAEDLIRNPDGFIATIACAKASSPFSNEELGRILLSSLSSGKSLGEAFYLAYTRWDNTYHFFGDPTVKTSFPPRREFPLLRQDTLRPKECRFSFSFGQGKERLFSARLFYGARLRRYTSTVYYNERPYVWSTSYILPGFCVQRLKGKVLSPLFWLHLHPPRGISQDTIFLGGPENFYWELPNTARLICFFQELDIGESSYVWLLDSLPRDTMGIVSADTSGPMIKLFAGNKEIIDTAVVPKNFILSGILFDKSGIFIAPSQYYPRVYIEKVEYNLSYLLRPDWTFNREVFNLEVSLSAETNKVKILAYDNLLNPNEKEITLFTSLRPRLDISSPLFVFKKNMGYFSFTLSYPAFVEVKIYTLNGRFIKSKSGYFGFGQNMLSFPLTLPRGVYLYKLQAQSALLQQRSVLYDKFLVY